MVLVDGQRVAEEKSQAHATSALGRLSLARQCRRLRAEAASSTLSGNYPRERKHWERASRAELHQLARGGTARQRVAQTQWV